MRHEDSSTGKGVDMADVSPRKAVPKEFDKTPKEKRRNKEDKQHRWSRWLALEAASNHERIRAVVVRRGRTFTIRFGHGREVVRWLVCCR
jgi:hypothetical protein